MNNHSKKIQVSKPVIIIGGVSIALIVLVLSLVIFGRLHVVFTLDKSTVSEHYNMCSDSDRKAFYEEYNKLDANKDTLKNLNSKITENPKYTKDPNCVYATLQYEYMINYNKDKASQLLSNLETLIDKNQYPDPTYTDVYSLAYLRNMVDAISDDVVNDQTEDNPTDGSNVSIGEE